MSRRIEDLDQKIQPLVKKLIDEFNKDSDWRAFITDGFRTSEEQDYIYASGRTRPGPILTNTRDSNHEKGLAIDIAFQKDGKLSYAQSHYDKLVPIAKKLGFTWGGDWKFVDKPHFEKLDIITEQPIAVPMDIRLELLDNAGIKTEGDTREVLGHHKDFSNLEKTNNELQSKYDELVKIHESVKQDFTLELAEVESKHKALREFLVRLAKATGATQNIEDVEAKVGTLVKDNDNCQTKLKAIEDNRPITKHPLDGVGKLLEELVKLLIKRFKNGKRK